MVEVYFYKLPLIIFLGPVVRLLLVTLRFTVLRAERLRVALRGIFCHQISLGGLLLCTSGG